MPVAVRPILFLFCVLLLTSCTHADPRPSAARVLPVTAEDCARMRAAQVIQDDNPVPCERLRRVNFDYVDLKAQPAPAMWWCLTSWPRRRPVFLPI